MVKFTYLCKDKTQREHMVFSVENKFTDKLISALWDDFSSLKFLFHRRLKNINNFCIVDLGPRPMTPENLHFAKKTIDQWNFCCISKNTNAVLQLFSTALNWGLVWETVV